MKNYCINIAKADTLSDWRGLPSHRHYAKLTLNEWMAETDAMAELERLSVVYPWPEYHLTLMQVETVTRGEHLASTAPADFLKAHGWAYASINNGEG